MPERTDDNNAHWEYDTNFPGGDYRINRGKVTAPRFVEATGLDGRFIGAVRPFPGMVGAGVHGVPKPEAGKTITSISNIQAAWYISIQKGVSNHTLKGLVYLADSQSGTGVNKSLYFAYRDSETQTSDVIELEDFNTWDDFKLTSVDEYDVTCLGRYIYLVVSGDTTSTVPSFQGKEPPYNKAYFWDWKINEWDRFVNGFDDRFMGLLPQRVLMTSVNEGGAGPVLEVGNNAATDGTATVDLSGDSPDLSDVEIGHTLLLLGRSDGANGSDQFEITAVDDGADTVNVTPTPGTTDSGISWHIQGDPTDDSEEGFKVDPPEGTFNETDPSGQRSWMCEVLSRKHNLRSYHRVFTKRSELNMVNARKLVVSRVKLPRVVFGGKTNQIQGPNNEGVMGNSCVTHWGIPHVDGFKFYRSPFNFMSNVESSATSDKYVPVGNLYKIEDYYEKGVYAPVSGVQFFQLWHWLPSSTQNVEPDVPFFLDEALVQQELYDPYLDAFEPAPRMKRIRAYDNLLVGITHSKQPSVTSKDWDTAEQRPEELAWSTLVRQEPENFPAENRYPADDPGQKFLSFEPAGDHLFAVATNGIFRVTRSGDQIALTRMQFRLGGVSRWGQTGVGNTLFMVTKAGVKSINGDSGAVQSISAMDRIIMDDREWATSLSSVIVEYDATIGALIFLNTTAKEMFILWEATGAVTRVKDCPWAFMVGGSDVLTDGPQRAYFVMSDGAVHVIDGARQNNRRAMCDIAQGSLGPTDVNGTVTTGSSTQIISAASVFPADCVGHKVYILSGNREGDVCTITERTSDTILTVTGLSGTTALGDRFSVAPVVTELTFPQVPIESGPVDRAATSQFVRKTVTSMSAAFSELGGETGSGDTNAEIVMGVEVDTQSAHSTDVAFDDVPDKCVGRVNAAGVRLYPYLRMYGGDQDWELQALLVKGIVGISEAQSRQA